MDKKKGMGKQMLGLLIYVCLSAMGLTLIKIGLDKNCSLVLDKTSFSLSFSWILVIGICLYILSFLTSMIVMKNMNLSVYYPLSAGLIYVVVCILSVLVLKEHLTWNQLVGMAIIFAGIIFMNVGKGN